LIAFFFKLIKGHAVFISALVTQVIVISLFLLNQYEIINLPFLWLNFVGCILAIMFAMIIDYKRISKTDKMILTFLIVLFSCFSYLILKNSNLL